MPYERSSCMKSDASALVSVIIPVCNVEKYLAQCLESICSQTHRELEVICLNDGSKDGSLAILREFEARDSRVIVVDKPNEGYGATCNRGLEMAHGAWVSVVEPDDWIDPVMYECMLSRAALVDVPVDIVKCPWIDVHDWDDPDTQYEQQCVLAHRLPNTTRPVTLADLPIMVEQHPSIWSAIYRRDFLNEYGIRFVPYPGAGWADNPFLIEVFCQARAIMTFDEAFYHYRCDLPGATYNHKKDAAVALPFDRWCDMTDILERLHVTDRGILEAHYMRGFNYIHGGIVDDGWENPIVQDGTRRVFSRMDADIVLGHPKLSPKRKRFYLEQMGITGRRVSVWPRLRYFSSEVAFFVRTNGVAGLAHKVGGFVGGKQIARARAKENAKG